MSTDRKKIVSTQDQLVAIIEIVAGRAQTKKTLAIIGVRKKLVDCVDFEKKKKNLLYCHKYRSCHHLLQHLCRFHDNFSGKVNSLGRTFQPRRGSIGTNRKKILAIIGVFKVL